MTNTPMTSREAFESHFKLPLNITFDDEFNVYFNKETGKTCHKETHRWEAWQACEQQNQAVIAERDAVIAKKDEALEFAEIKLLNREFKSDLISKALAIQPSSNVLDEYVMSRLEVAGIAYNDVDGKTQFALYRLKGK